MNYFVLTHNRISQWDDKIGEHYNFPRKYKNLDLEGSIFLYYHGKNNDPFDLTKKSDPMYFGLGRLGEKMFSIEQDSYFIKIEKLTLFRSKVSFKNSRGYLEEIPESKSSNYFRDGIRELSEDNFIQIIFECLKTESLSISKGLEIFPDITTKFSFSQWLTLNVTEKLRYRLPLILEHISEKGIDYDEIKKVRNVGKKKIEQILVCAENFSGDIIDSENLEQFRLVLLEKGSNRIKNRVNFVLNHVKKYGGVYYEKLFSIENLGKKSFKEIQYLWNNFVRGRDLERFKIDHGFISFLIAHGSVRILNRISLIEKHIHQSGDIHGLQGIRGLGASTIEEIKTLLGEYRIDPFKLTEEELILQKCEDAIHSSSEAFINVINELDRNRNYITFRSKLALHERITIIIKQSYPSINDSAFVVGESDIVLYTYLQFWTKLTPFHYNLYIQFFDSSLSDLSRERRRQIFKASNNEPYELPDILGFDFVGAPNVLRNYSIQGYGSYVSDSILFLYSKKISWRGYLIPEHLNPAYIKILISALGYAYINEGSKIKVVTKKDIERIRRQKIIEKYVTFNEDEGVLTKHLCEELDRYGIKVDPTYLPGYIKRNEFDIRQRLDWTWVKKDGLLDRDPDVKSFKEFFETRISRGNSFHEALAELRKYYPDYRVRNGMALLNSVNSRHVKDIREKMFLGHWSKDNDLRKKFIVLMKYPKSALNKVVHWHPLLLKYYVAPTLDSLNNNVFWIYKMSDYEKILDLRDYIRESTWNARVIFKYKDIYYNIDFDELDVY